jgi:hypothetical protein
MVATGIKHGAKTYIVTMISTLFRIHLFRIPSDLQFILSEISRGYPRFLHENVGECTLKSATIHDRLIPKPYIPNIQDQSYITYVL